MKWYINKHLHRHKLRRRRNSTDSTHTKFKIRNRILDSLKIDMRPEHTDSAEEPAKLHTTLTLLTQHQEYCYRAIVHTTLYDPTAMQVLGEDTNECEFKEGLDPVTLSVNLAPQDKINKSTSEYLEVRIIVKICGSLS